MTKVSVCIPVYNGVKYLSETIHSVQKQTVQDFTILVQDNNSTDGTWELLLGLAKDDSRLHPLRNEKNLGMAGNWNTVMDRAETPFLMLLSADDLLEPTFLETALAKFNEDTTLGSVSFNHSLIQGNRSWVRKMDLREGKYSRRADIVLLKNPFSVNFTLYKKSFLDSIRRFGKIFGHFYTCDFGLHIRVAAAEQPLLYIDKPLGIYRVHGENLSLQAFRMRRQKALTTLSLKRDLLPKYAWSYRYCLARPLIGSFIFYLKNGKLDRKLWTVVPRRIVRSFKK